MTTANGSFSSATERQEQARNWLLAYVVILLGFGLLMVFSVGYVQGLSEGGSARFSLALSQLCYMLLGGLALVTAYSLPRGVLRRMSLPLLIVSLILLCLVWAPGMGKEVRGGSRWIGVGPLNLQASEFAKIALVLWLSAFFSGGSGRSRREVRVAVPLTVIILFSGLVLAEPHIGNAGIMALSGFAVMYFAGVRWRKLLGGALIGLMLCVVAIGGSWAVDPGGWGKKWQDKWERLEHFYSKGGVEANRYGEGYQSFQSLLAISSGGLPGKGVGGSRTKFNYLPDGHTDFIYAILGEELGFAACLLVLLCFLGLIGKSFSLGLQMRDRFGALLLCGLSVTLGVQALINMAMVMAWLPAIGLPLPFVSYGGSSLLASMSAVGLMLRASHFKQGARDGWQRR